MSLLTAGTWFGFGITDDQNPELCQCSQRIRSAGRQISVIMRLVIGLKKLVPYQTAVSNSNLITQGYSWPFFRLPALWLLYAECLNEVGGPGGEAYSYIDMVRARAGLPGVLQAWASYSNIPGKPATRDGFRQIIHQETRIELAFEGQAGWALRRWKELQNVLANPFQGWNVFGKTTANYYNTQTVYQPVFNLKDYLFPVQTYDLIINPDLVQTPYW